MKLLISGSSGGIGAAVKAAALVRGWEVVEVNRADYDSGNPLLPGEGAFAEEDRFDAVAFCTGMCPVRPAALTADGLFEETLRVNCGYFLRLMREIIARKAYGSAGMKAVAVSSVSAVEGWPGGAAYCASKGALSALCRALDAELKPKGIAVTALEPRYVKTRMFDACAGRMGVSASEAVAPAVFAEELVWQLSPAYMA